MNPIKIAIDVLYHEDEARVGAVGFADWKSDEIVEQHAFKLPIADEYIPGQFYKRELPCILDALNRFEHAYDTVIVDGYVWLGDRKGLGAHLYEKLDEKIEVIGVAKNPFSESTAAEILRGQSERPIFVTAAGIDQSAAADLIREMHGKYRMPTILKEVDRISRSL